MTSERFILTVVHDSDTIDHAESFSSLMTLRGHYVRVFNETGRTNAMCHGCFELLVEDRILIPNGTIVVCFKELTFDEARLIDSESKLLVQILSGRSLSPRASHAIWSSRAGFFYSHGVRESKFKLERHQIINLPLFERDPVETSRELVLVFGNRTGLKNEVAFDIESLNKAKVVVVNSKRLFSVSEILVSKILARKIPIICWSGTQVEEFIEDGVSGFVINSHAEILNAIEKVENLNVEMISPKFSSENLCEKFERFFSADQQGRVGLVDLFMIGEPTTSELCQRIINEKDTSGYSVVRLQDVWSPGRSSQLNDLWKNGPGSSRTMIPLKVESILSVCQANGVSGIDLMLVSGEFQVENLVKEFEKLESVIRPRQIVFDQEQQGTEQLERWGYRQSKDSECLFVSTRVRKIGFDPSMKRFVHGIQDNLSRKGLHDKFSFEEIDRDSIFEYSKIISMDRQENEVLERRRVDPRMVYAIDPQAFPRKFYPKRLKTVGIFGKPKMKVIGRLVDGKLVLNEPVETRPGEIDQDQIVEVVKRSGLGLRYIHDIPSSATFETFRDLDLIVFNETSILCQEAFEAVFCGVPIVSINTGLLKSFDHLKFSSKEEFEKAIDVLSDEKVYVEYRDSLFKIIEESLSMDKLKLNFLK